MCDPIILYTEELDNKYLINLVQDIKEISLYAMYWDITECPYNFSSFVNTNKKTEAYYFCKIIEALENKNLDETCMIYNYISYIENYVNNLDDDMINKNKFKSYLVRVARDKDCGITELIRLIGCKYYIYMCDTMLLPNDVKYDKVKGYIGVV